MLDFLYKPTKKVNTVWVSHQKATNNPPFRLKIQRINVLPILQDIAQTVTPLANSKQIQLKLRYFSDPLYAETDPDSFAQVAFQLLRVGLERMPVQGSMTLDAYRLGSDFVLNIALDEPAIGEEEIAYLFKLNQREQADLSPMAQLLHAGLPSVKEIVDAHRGQLYFESQNGRGSTFTLKLPMIGDVYQ